MDEPTPSKTSCCVASATPSSDAANICRSGSALVSAASDPRTARTTLAAYHPRHATLRRASPRHASLGSRRTCLSVVRPKHSVEGVGRATAGLGVCGQHAGPSSAAHAQAALRGVISAFRHASAADRGVRSRRYTQLRYTQLVLTSCPWER